MNTLKMGIPELGLIAQYTRIQRSLDADRVIKFSKGMSAQTRRIYTIGDCESLYGVISLFLNA